MGVNSMKIVFKTSCQEIQSIISFSSSLLLNRYINGNVISPRIYRVLRCRQSSFATNHFA